MSYLCKQTAVELFVVIEIYSSRPSDVTHCYTSLNLRHGCKMALVVPTLQKVVFIYISVSFNLYLLYYKYDDFDWLKKNRLISARHLILTSMLYIDTPY